MDCICFCGCAAPLEDDDEWYCEECLEDYHLESDDFDLSDDRLEEYNPILENSGWGTWEDGGLK